jgi:hypothetical protein
MKSAAVVALVATSASAFNLKSLGLVSSEYPTAYPTATYPLGVDTIAAGLRAHLPVVASSNYPTAYPTASYPLSFETEAQNIAKRFDGEMSALRASLPTGYTGYTGAYTGTHTAPTIPTAYPTYPTGYPTHAGSIFPFELAHGTETVQFKVPTMPTSVTLPKFNVAETRENIVFPTVSVPRLNFGMGTQTFALPTGYPTHTGTFPAIPFLSGHKF